MSENKKPNGYWTEERCLEEAKKYKTYKDFISKGSSAYQNSVRKGWIKNYTWLESEVKPKGYWTYERCKEEAEKYKTSGEFRKEGKTAYTISCKNNWLWDWFKETHHIIGYWNEENCRNESKKYKTRHEFLKGSPTAYERAKENNWLDSYTWLSFGIQIKWTEEACQEESKKYKTKAEFMYGSPTAYEAARKNNWLGNYTWEESTINVDIFKDERKIDCVYAYEFTELNSVYVGRTLIRRKKARDSEHRSKRLNDTVMEFATKNSVEIPNPKYLEDNLTIKEGVEKEALWIEVYKEEGWTVINKAKPGSIGSMNGLIWNYEKCYEEAKKYSKAHDFIVGSFGAYKRAKDMGWLVDYTWISGYKPRYEYNYDTCLEEAKKYTSLNEFRQNSPGYSNYAESHGWLDSYTWLKRRFFWTDATLLEEAKKYSSRSEFAKKKPGAYEYALEHNLLDKCTWFSSCCKPNGYWNYNTCYEEANKYKTRKEFEIGAPGAYHKAVKENWLDNYTWFTSTETRKHPAGFWTKDRCIEESKKYKTMKDFRKNCSNSAYKASKKNGWLDEFTWLEKD